MSKQNIKVQEFKINIGGKNYTFRLDFAALIKFEERLGTDGIVSFNQFLQGENTYRNIIKILSCCCVEKDFTEEELAKGLSFNFQTMQLMDNITFALIEGVFEKDDTEKGSNEGKNEITNQG